MIPVSFGGDLGFVSDSSALAGVASIADRRYVVVHLEELRPRKGHPLKPKSVIDTFATSIKAYGSKAFMADGYARESAREHLEPHEIRFVDAPAGREGKTQVFMLARKLILEKRVRLPNHPRLLAQLRSVVSKPVPGGGVSIGIPRRKGGGHGDLVSALTLALWQAHHNRGGHVDPAAMVRFQAELAAAKARGGPWLVSMPGGGCIGSDGGFEYMTAGYGDIE